MRVLVTGAAGFIGSQLCDRLVADGHDLLAVDCFTASYDVAKKVENVARLRKHKAVTFAQVDLRSDDLGPFVDDVDTVFHQAALAGVRASWDHRFSDYATHNVLATQRLLEASRHAGVRRFVYASSSSIYGNALAYPTSEDTVPAPFSPYGVTKLAAEHLCQAYANNFGLVTVSLRYFTVYGPRQRPDMGIYRLIRSALTGEPFELYGDGSQRREFTYVDDIVDANLLAATVEVEKGGVCNIAGGGDISLSGLINLVSDFIGRPVNVVPADAMPGDVRRNSGAIDRAASLLGWGPRISFEEGLRRQIEWHRSELPSG